MQPRTRLVYFYFLIVNFLVKASTSGRCDQVWLPWQQNICRSRYGCFCLSPQVTYLHTKIEGNLKFFISNFASLSWRIVPLKWYKKYIMYMHTSLRLAVVVLYIRCSAYFSKRIQSFNKTLWRSMLSLFQYVP